MIPNIHQSIEEIIKNASAAEKIIWQQIRLLTGETAAIQQLYYAGPITRFTNYVARTIYLALEIDFSYNVASAVVTPDRIIIYDELNNAINYLHCANPVYNGTSAALNYSAYNAIHSNLMFSRVAVINFTNVKFIGYKIVY